MGVESKRYDLFKNALNQGECIISDFCNDKIFDLSCIILEFYSVLEYFSICIDKTTGVLAPTLINAILDDIERKSIQYCNRIDNALNLSQDTTFNRKICRNRLNNYETIHQQGIAPIGFCLMSDYPRSDNEVRDSLIRVMIAFCDFSLFFLANRRPASFVEDIDTLIVFGIDECVSYTELFSKISNIVFNYFYESLQVVHDNKEPKYKERNDTRYWDLVSPIPTAPTTKIPESPVKEGTLATIIAITFIIIVLAILLSIYFS